MKADREPECKHSNNTEIELFNMNEYYEDLIHDIKTPFSILASLMSSLNANQDIDSAAAETIQKMQSCTDQIMNLLLNSQNYVGDSEHKTIAVHYINYDVVALTDSIVVSINPLADRKNISVLFDTDCEEKIMAVDKLIFERIMLNLLSNAIKFSPKDSTVEVELIDNSNGNDHTVVIEVKDSGSGVSAEWANTMFERYEKTDVSDAVGSGLGLHIVKNFVQQLGGSISAYNRPLQTGTIVRIELPVNMLNDQTDERYIGMLFPGK